MMRVTLVKLNRKPELADGFKGRRVVIWSGEHNAFWRENAAGYATDIDDAGVYSFEAAHYLTEHCGPEKKIKYVVVA